MRIEVSRSVLVEDLLRYYREIPDIVNKRALVSISREAAVDVNGLFRDVLTSFWDEVMESKFNGEMERIPVVDAI